MGGKVIREAYSFGIGSAHSLIYVKNTEGRESLVLAFGDSGRGEPGHLLARLSEGNFSRHYSDNEASEKTINRAGALDKQYHKEIAKAKLSPAALSIWNRMIKPPKQKAAKKK